MNAKISRRSFLKTSAAASTVFSLMPASVLGANEKVNLACIGIGGQGHRVAQSINDTGMPESIEALKLKGHKKNIFPMASTIKFDFPKRGKGMPAMDITWYDGKKIVLQDQKNSMREERSKNVAR